MNDWQRFGYKRPTTRYYRLIQQLNLKNLLKMILYGSIFFLAVFLLISKFLTREENDKNMFKLPNDNFILYHHLLLTKSKALLLTSSWQSLILTLIHV